MMFFGIVLSQKTFYASIDLLTKMSFNSTHPSLWDTQNADVSPIFEYNQSSYSIVDPFRLGVSLGWNINPKHNIEMGAHFDGVTAKSTHRFSSYQEFVDYYTPNIIKYQSRSQQNRFFINYKYSLLKKVDKTNFSIFGSLALVTRAGPKEVGDVGSFGSSGIIVKDSIIFESEYTAYTSNVNKALQIGLGMSSDIYISSKYWLTLSLQYAFSRSFLSFSTEYFSVKYLNSGEVYKYVFSQYNKASGLYFGISRHFYLDNVFKKKNNAHNSK